MSGRAGRRGIDERGTVVLLLAEEMDESAFLKMISGQSLPLASAFRLRYNTLLKLYKMEVRPMSARSAPSPTAQTRAPS